MPCWSRLAFLGLLLFACDRMPDDAREWQPADHDHGARPVPSAQASSRPLPHPSQPMPGLGQAAMQSWIERCVLCHGKVGRGDGPQGPELRARDLSDPGWQSSTSDEQIARAIRRGQAPMPAFDLPDPTIQGLVALVRLMGPGPTGQPP